MSRTMLSALAGVDGRFAVGSLAGEQPEAIRLSLTDAPARSDKHLEFG
jgi:hypothetical protein